MVTQSRISWLVTFGLLYFLVNPAGAGNYNLPNAPINPTTYEDCKKVSAWEACREIREASNNCGSIFDKRCQELTSHFIKCSDYMSEQFRICRDRLQNYKDQQQALLKQQEEQGRQAREAEQNQQRQAREAENGRQRQAQEARTAYEQAMRAEQQKAAAIREYNQRRQQEKAAKAQALTGMANALGELFSSGEAESAGSGQAQSEQGRVIQDQHTAQARERLEKHAKGERKVKEAKEARERLETSLYDQLAAQLESAGSLHDTYQNIKRAIESPVEAALEQAGGSANSAVMNNAVAAAMQGTEERPNREYDAAANILNRTRAAGMAGNPVADAVSDTAMEGINSMHRRAFGEMEKGDKAVNSYMDDLKQEGRSSSGSGQMLRSTPAPRGGGASAYTSDAPASYYDPDTRKTLEVPSGHVLYREPDTKRIVVVSASQIPEQTSGDRPELGDKGCSKTGIGIVTPVCEKKRRAKARR